MGDWQARVEAIRAALQEGRLEAAIARLSEALAACPDQLWLLTTASDVYRAAGQHYTALLYAQQLLRLYPHTFHGYCRGAGDLARLGRMDEANALIQRGLDQFPKEFWVLMVAGDLHRQQGRREQALACARALIEAHPQQASGYTGAAQDLLVLRRFAEAQAVVEAGLQHSPDDVWLLMVAHDVYHVSDQQERSLHLAQQLIACHPSHWQGYARATQDLVALKRFEEALDMARAGLGRATEHRQLVRLEAYARRFVGQRAHSHTVEGASATALSLRDMIAYAHLPSFFSDLQSLRTRSDRRRGERVGKNLLFVAGLGRSGTTALGQLLNISAAIELYTELYDPSRLNGYQPEDFQLPRLRAALASHRQPGDAELFAAKHEGSRWIGDKRPNLQFCLESSYDNLVPEHGLCTIYIQRDLRAVLRSSHRRSENLEDLSWSREHGLEHTVLLHNASCRQLIDLHRRRPEVFASIQFVTYAEVFSDPACSQRLFRQLGVELSLAEQGRLSAFLAASAARTQSGPSSGSEADALGAQIEAVIARHLDRDAERTLAAISGLPETRL